MSLKRSSELGGDHPKHIRSLETLNVFALRADYMDMFRKYLEEEGVHGTVKFQLPTRPNLHLLGARLGSAPACRRAPYSQKRPT